MFRLFRHTPRPAAPQPSASQPLPPSQLPWLLALAALVLLPASLWLGASWVETAVLAGVALLVLITELLNSGIEAAIDRIGPDWHPLSKRAKDMGSAAVLLALLLCAAVWCAALYHRFLS